MIFLSLAQEAYKIWFLYLTSFIAKCSGIKIVQIFCSIQKK